MFFPFINPISRSYVFNSYLVSQRRLQRVEDVEIGGQFFLCAGKVVGAVVSALDFLATGDRIEFEAFCDALFGERKCLVFVHIKQKQIKARSAPHRAEIYHLVLVRAVAHHGGKQVLYGVHSGYMKVISFIRLFEAQIVCEHVFIHTTEVKSLFEHVVVDCKRRNLFHSLLYSLTGGSALAPSLTALRIAGNIFS